MRLLLLVVAWHYQLAYLLAERSPQERDDLRAGAVIARRKGCLTHARGHAVHVAPRHRFIRPFGHIGERQVEHPRAREALTLRLSAAVDHGRSLRTGADAVRVEAACAYTGGDAVFDCPHNGLVEIAARRNVDKFVRPCKADLDGMVSADILKGVGLHRADALAVDLDVGDSIALVWGDGEGLIPALADADIAGGRNGAASPGSCLDGVVAVIAACGGNCFRFLVLANLADTFLFAIPI